MNLKYICIGVVRRHVPARLLFAVMKWRGDGNAAERTPGACLADWRERLAKYGASLGGKHVLEVGSGRYARLGLHLLAAGARRVTLVDIYAVPVDEPDHRALLVRDCADVGLDIDYALARIHVIQEDFAKLAVPDAKSKVD